MEALKLTFVTPLMPLLESSNNFFLWLLNLVDPLLLNTWFVWNSCIAQNMTFFFSLKFLLCIAFLILIRGGTPRYRYDYLTKLGWLKFLSLVILIFFLSFFFTFTH